MTKFTTVLDSQGGMVSVGNELAESASRKAQLIEDVPAAWTVREQARVGATAHPLNELQRVLDGRWFVPDFWIGDDANEAARAQLRKRKRFRPLRGVG